jgi:hypothetical protein
MVGMVLEIMRCTGARRARFLSIDLLQNWLNQQQAESRELASSKTLESMAPDSRAACFSRVSKQAADI